MIVLGIDTSTEQLALALARDDRVIAEISIAEGLEHCERLIVGLDGILGDLGLCASDVGGLCVTTGPGSFTGLRIGVAAAQGFALAHDLPVVGLSTLEALAFSAGATAGVVVPCLDARRGEVYFCAYGATEGRFERLMKDALLPIDGVAGALDIAAGAHVTVVGTAAEALAAQLREHGIAATVPPLGGVHARPGIVALLGQARLARGQGEPAGAIEPVYLRRADAEIERRERSTRPA